MWVYYPETAAAFASLSRGSERPILVVEGKYRPSDEQGAIFAEALNTLEQTGLTPAQLQARVAELEAALRKLEHVGVLEVGELGFDDVVVEAQKAGKLALEATA